MRLTLDAPPMRGSKRVPLIDIGDNGEVKLELWCKSAIGQLSIAGDSVVFVPGPVQDSGCSADRAAADDNVLAALAEATGWKRQGDWLTFTGPHPLRFQLLTN
jgi:META domain